MWQFAVILEQAEIGEDCNVNCHTFIENHVKIGNNVTIKSGVYLWDGIIIEDDVFIGPSVSFVNNPYPRSKQYPEKHVGALIKKGVSVGANATIMGALEIGEYAMIGAGSVVTKPVTPFSLWFGNPAKQKGYVTRTGVVLNLELMDKEGKKYILLDTGEPVVEQK